MEDYDEKLREIIGVFRKDMQRGGIFVGQEIKDASWDDLSFRYYVRAGTQRYLPEDKNHAPIDWEKERKLIDNEGFLGDTSTLRLDFRTESYMEGGRAYKVIIPGEIETSSTSLIAMVDGVRLLTSIERWAYLNAKLENAKQSRETHFGIDKLFKLDLKALFER